MIFNTYSERQKIAAGVADVYQYEDVPQRLRVQLQQILRDAIGPHVRMSGYETHSPEHNPEIWKYIHRTLSKELGVHTLSRAETKGKEVIEFLASCTATEFVDVVELCVRAIDRVLRTWSPHERQCHGIRQEPDEALEEINHRFRRAGFGYQFAEGSAFRVDTEFVHEEVVKPALRILSARGYEGPREEFLSAHRHYRNGDHEEAITEAAKAFESTLKVACERNGWPHQAGARASDLLKTVRSNGLWPAHLDGSFDQLIATLSSGLPKVRNEQGAHGQGSTIRDTPAFVAAYAMHLAAAKIILVAEAAEARAKEPVLLE